MLSDEKSDQVPKLEGGPKYRIAYTTIGVTYDADAGPLRGINNAAQHDTLTFKKGYFE